MRSGRPDCPWIGKLFRFLANTINVIIFVGVFEGVSIPTKEQVLGRFPDMKADSVILAARLALRFLALTMPDFMAFMTMIVSRKD